MEHLIQSGSVTGTQTNLQLIPPPSAGTRLRVKRIVVSTGVGADANGTPIQITRGTSGAGSDNLVLAYLQPGRVLVLTWGEDGRDRGPGVPAATGIFFTGGTTGVTVRWHIEYVQEKV